MSGWDSLSTIGVDLGNPSQNDSRWTKICSCHPVLWHVFPSCCAFQGWLEVLPWLLSNLLVERSTCVSQNLSTCKCQKPISAWLVMGGCIYWLTEFESSRVSLAPDTAGPGHWSNVIRLWSSSVFIGSAFFLCWLYFFGQESPPAEAKWLHRVPESQVYNWVTPAGREYLSPNNSNKSLWIDPVTCVSCTWTNHCAQGKGNMLIGWDWATCPPLDSPDRVRSVKYIDLEYRRGKLLDLSFPFRTGRTRCCVDIWPHIIWKMVRHTMLLVFSQLSGLVEKSLLKRWAAWGSIPMLWLLVKLGETV